MAVKAKTSRANSHAHDVPTVIEFLLDETGSMQSIKDAAINGFNDFLAEQRAQPGTCLLTLTKFDSSGLKTPYVDIDVGMAPNLTADTFVPAQMTNLRDAIMTRIRATIERTNANPNKVNVLFVCLTDGGDNCSREYVSTVQQNLQQLSERHQWSFVYLGADQNALAVAEQLGFPAGNVKSFASKEMRQTMQNLAAATTAYRATRAAGDTTSTKQFFAG